MLLLLALLLSSAFLHLVPALDDEGTEPPPQQLTLQRDSVLEAPLLELLLAPLWTESGDASTPLDIRLQSAFSQCRELGVTSFLYETSVDTSGGALPALDPLDVAYCHRLRYVRHQREHARSVRKELAAKHSVPENLPSVERRPAADVSFQEFFELYAEKSRPLILELHEDDKDPVAQLLGLTASSDDGGGIESTLDNFIGVCFGDNKSSKHQNENRGMSMRPMRVEDGSCAALLESTFRVPIYMTHDYLQRTNASRDEAFVPSIIDLPAAASDQDDGPASADDIVSCPYGLHMLVIPLGDSVGTHISLFNRKFKPIKMPVRMQEHREVALAADANVAAGSRGNTVLDAAIFEQAPEQYSSIELKPGKDMLFAPGGIIPSMRSAIPSSAGAKVLRFCYCDAANIKDVKQAAGLDALLMTEDNKDLGVYALLHAFQSPGFDTSFTRRPALSDCSWHNFVQWPREPAYLSKKNRRSRGGGANNDDVEGEDEQMSRRERLKQWQDDKRWERYVASLTLPVAWPPIVVNTTRTTATLRWQELYQPLKHDLTSYGYEVSWKREDQDATAPKPSEERETMGSAVNVTHDQITRSRMPSTLFGDDFDGRDLEAVITGLQAETAYSFSVRLLVGDTRGAASGASRRVATSPCAQPSRIRGVPEALIGEGTCLILRWLEAEDDGGKNIELYLVSSETLPKNGEGDDFSTGTGPDNAAVIREHEKVIAVNASIDSAQIILEKSGSGAPWLSTQVCGLLPGGVYRLRVAAMNVLGAGLWSHRSSSIKIPRQSRRRLSSTGSGGSHQGVAVPILKGVGDPGYTVVSGVDILSQNDLSTLVAQDPQHIFRTSGAQIKDVMLPRVLLSDVEEQVRVLSNNNSEESMGVVRSFEAWASHHSPRIFDVSAELVLADPPDASGPLRNAHAVRDRVVLALRGGVPFVFKLHYAQRAGALGLIIADANGSCSGSFDQSCVPGADKGRREGFAAQERHRLWDQARIPCVLVLQDAAKDLLERLNR